MKGMILHLLLIALALYVSGCGRPHDQPTSGRRATDFSTNVTAYEVRGVLKEIRKSGAAALIDHEDIPGYMEAMTMLLDVKDTNELAGLTTGDAITFRMLVTDSDGWIDRVKKTGRGVVPTNAPIADAFADVPEIAEGAPLPDCALTNQDGRAIRLADFRGQALAFTFIFTRCPFPVYCPRMSGNFATVQRELLASTPSTNWQLISISFDPDFDTPATLRSYGQAFGRDPAHWSFATAPATDIRRFGAGFGLMFRKTETGSIDHNVRTVVVDRAGRVQKIFADNEWKPAELAAEMRKAMLSTAPAP
jgi:protein SCO1/2